jgi:TorA maturation chaperone TorD
MDTQTLPFTADPALLFARRTCYRFMSLALADPRNDTFSQLAHPETRKLVLESAEMLREERTAVTLPLARGERPLSELDPAMIFARLPCSAAELNTLYENTFGLLGGSKCPPYATEYVPSRFTFQRSNMLADVAGFYHAFGLQTSSSHPDRPDHVSLQCEFLAQLLQLQLRSMSALPGECVESLATQAATCQKASHRFLQEHFAWWAPSFARLMTQQGSGGFYEAVGHFLAAFVAAERGFAGIGPPNRSAEPSPIENADPCAGCELTLQ